MEKKRMTLGGKELRCLDALPMGLIFDLAEAMEGSEMKQVAGMARFLKTIVVKEDLPKLQEVLYDTKNPATFADLNVAIGTLMKEYTGRPLGKPAPSQRGDGATGGTSRVVSLSRARDKKDAKSSQGGESVAS